MAQNNAKLNSGHSYDFLKSYHIPNIYQISFR